MKTDLPNGHRPADESTDARAAYLDARMRGLCDDGAEEVARGASDDAVRDEEVAADNRQPDSGLSS